jgi:hypothetical protein
MYQVQFVELDLAVKITSRRVNALEHVSYQNEWHPINSKFWNAGTDAAFAEYIEIYQSRVGGNGAGGILSTEESVGKEEGIKGKGTRGRKTTKE